MNSINWKVRLANKSFWIAFIPAIILLIQAIASVFGFSMDLSDLQDKLLVVVNAVFSVLVIIGVVADPTTTGIGDSERALSYDKPNNDHNTGDAA